MASIFETDFAVYAAQIDDLCGETVVHYPAGNLAAGVNVMAIVDRDAEDGGGVGLGEGAQIDTRESVQLRRTATLELADSVAVTERSGTTGSPSIFAFGGKRWTAVRIVARQLGKQKVLVTRTDRLAARRAGRSR
ncbi:MAG: hypothetical protein M3Q42_11815 [Pseudomonadota bacterium]|nr:hypothetical protein [Pseudomonadota bacterium]